MSTLVLTALLLAPAAGPPPGPAAMVLEVAGRPTLQRAGAAPRPLRAMELLHADDLLQPQGGPVTLVVFADGHGEKLKTQAAVRVKRDGCQPAESVERLKPKVAGGQFEKIKDLVGTSGRAGAVITRTIAEDPRDRYQPRLRKEGPYVTPVHGSSVYSVRPAFSWPPAPGATIYVVSLREVRDAGERVVWQEESREPRLDYPAAAPPLKRGASYQWTVTGRPGGAEARPVAESRFRVVAESEERALREFLQLGEGDDPAGWALAAVAFDSLAVSDQALKLFAKLSRRYPDEPNYLNALYVYYRNMGRAGEAERMKKRFTSATAQPPEK